jgi:hypothetical protein
MAVVRTATLHGLGQGRAFASLEVGKRVASGNWPIEMTVDNLSPLKNARGYYLLLLWRNGKPAGFCGAFKTAGETKVHFDVPYEIDPATKWVITKWEPGDHYPGDVVMKMTAASRA